MEKEGPFTLFLPVNEAIEALDAPLNEMSSKELKKFVHAHMVNGNFLSMDLMKHESLKRINKKLLQIEVINGKVQINQSRLLFKNTEAQNGVIHYIYPVL